MAYFPSRTRRPRARARAVALAAVLTVAAGCARPERLYEAEFTGETQGTTYSIKVAATRLPEDRLEAADHAIRARLDRIDGTLSVYNPDSDISRFNRSESTEPFAVAPEVVEVVGIARDVSELTGGAFDVTVGPLVNAWGFGPPTRVGGSPTRAAGPAKPADGPPADSELEALRARVGYAMVEADPAAGTLRKALPGLECDLNGIAQGYTVDKLAGDLDGLGWENYMVEVGGEVRARGVNARGIPWQIGIEKPVPGARAVQQVVPLLNTSISTSGDYRKFYEQNGVRVSHTIDPHTGRPITHALAAVSVVHPQCAMADALCTGFMVLGPGKGYALAVERNLPALFVVHAGEGAFESKPTPAFTALLENAGPPAGG